MIISVASGKGGTGKTTIAVNLAMALAEDEKKMVHFLDCDVEEPNAHLFLKPLIEKIEPVEIPIPKIDYEKCNFCGKCAQACVFNALAVTKNKVLVFPDLCHGCGACTYVCPKRAISEEGSEIGVIEEGKAGFINFMEGRLNIGESVAPPIIREIKEKGIKKYQSGKKKDKNKDSQHILLIDAPPGTSCPVIESIKGSDYVILVTEPTPFGLHDLLLAVEVLKRLQIPFGVVLNKSDIGDQQVEKYCQENKIPILMSLPMDKEIAIAYSKGLPLIELGDRYKQKFISLFQNVNKEYELVCNWN